MAIPLLAPLLDLLRARAGDVAGRAATVTVTVGLAVVATALLVAAGLVALTSVVGFPVAALVFAAVFVVLALAVHLLGRRRLALRAAQAADARNRAEADIAIAAALAQSAQPLLPLAAFLTAFALARRP